MAPRKTAYGWPCELGGRVIGVGFIGTIVFGLWLSFSNDYAPWDGWIAAALILWVIGGSTVGRAGAEYQKVLERATPHDLRRSFCSLAGRRGVDPIEAAQITGHSPAVWARFYARSFGQAQRDEARRRMLEHGFGDVR